MRPRFLLACWLFVSPAGAQSPPEVLNRCQGEGCDCYAAYRDGLPRSIPVPTIRPFTLHRALDLSSPVLGRFAAGTTALPLGEKTVVLERGEYRVRKLLHKDLDLHPLNMLHTVLSDGEGALSARRQRGSEAPEWVSFDAEALELKTVRKTRTQAWVEMQVGQLRGFAPHAPYGPFEACLE